MYQIPITKPFGHCSISYWRLFGTCNLYLGYFIQNTYKVSDRFIYIYVPRYTRKNCQNRKR